VYCTAINNNKILTILHYQQPRSIILYHVVLKLLTDINFILSKRDTKL